jgi:acyl-CoA reductase-like NAD-dependent aldehyde dehydrogenase
VERRAGALGNLRRAIVRERDEIAGEICADTGKTACEALLSDLLPTLEMLRYLEKNAPRILGPRRESTPFPFQPGRSRVEYRPRGVVLVIAPWNNPFQLSVVPVVSALVAGNAVILKPSERTPRTAGMIERLFADTLTAGKAMQIVRGGPSQAKALTEARPDMVFFTGGVGNGHAVLKTCARQMIPAILELGGKDPMIVLDDADLERAARAAVYGAFAHAGQHCVSVKRLYVQSGLHDALLDRIVERTWARITAGDWGRVEDGPPAEAARSQVAAALEDGARLLVPERREEAVRQPTVLADADNSMRIMREETFAPVLGAMRFENLEEAVRLANDSEFGLNASIWSSDRGRAEALARQLEVGNCYVNGVLTNIGNPHLPFGGMKSSGLGRYHGEEGVLAFCEPLSLMVSRSRRSAEPYWFPHDEERTETVGRLIELRYGGGSWIKRALGWLKLGMRLARGKQRGTT